MPEMLRDDRCHHGTPRSKGTSFTHPVLYDQGMAAVVLSTILSRRGSAGHLH